MPVDLRAPLGAGFLHAAGGFPASPQTDFRSQAFRWTEAQGMISLGDLPGGVVRSEALDVSADGSVVVGSVLTLRPDGQEVQNAFFWTEPTGMVDLRQALIAGGVLSLENSRLIEATGVSADGLTIVGTAFHNGQQQAFVATIPEPSTIALAAVGCLFFALRIARRSSGAAAS